MRIAMVDDLLEDLAKLQTDVCRWAEESMTPLIPAPMLFDSSEALLESMKQTTYDVIFLDIYMKGLSGMDAARLIRETDQNCCLIFTTSTPEFAVESYDVESSYYLVKPYSYEKLSLALDRCLSSVLKQEQYVILQNKSIAEKFRIHEIAYTEYINRHVMVHMKNGSVRSISMRQKDLAEALEKYPCFCDCMKGILVNFESVEKLEKDRFYLKNGHYVPISRLKYQNVREQFLAYFYAKVRGESND